MPRATTNGRNGSPARPDLFPNLLPSVSNETRLPSAKIARTHLAAVRDHRRRGKAVIFGAHPAIAARPVCHPRRAASIKRHRSRRSNTTSRVLSSARRKGKCGCPRSPANSRRANRSRFSSGYLCRFDIPPSARFEVGGAKRRSPWKLGPVLFHRFPTRALRASRRGRRRRAGFSEDAVCRRGESPKDRWSAPADAFFFKTKALRRT